MGSFVYFLCFSIHANVFTTIVSNHAKYSVGAKIAQIHSVLEKQAPNIRSKRKRTPHENQKFPL